MERKGRFLFVTMEGGGNIPPVLGLAERLIRRGHEVHVLTEPCLRENVEKIGAEFSPFRRHFVREDRAEDIIGDSEARTPLGAMKKTFDRIIFGPAGIVAEETQRVLRERSFDVVAADVMTPGSLVAAEAAQLPRVVLFHMPESLPGPGRPAAGPGFLPRTDLIGRMRDRLLRKMFFRNLKQYVAGFNDVRRQYGLSPYTDVEELVDQFNQADRRLILTTREFDFPIDPAPSNVRYVGPILDDPGWVGEWENPWPADDRRPLVVVSFSTTYQNQRSAIERVMEGVAGLDVRVLVTLGPAMSKQRFQSSENVEVVSEAPHTEVFPHAAAVVTHGGHGTVIRALASGVPLLCMPMGRDQDDNAARVFWHGAGLRLKVTASPQRIAAALERVLQEPTFRDNAKRLGAAIVRDAAEERGVAELESLLGKGIDVGSSPEKTPVLAQR